MLPSSSTCHVPLFKPKGETSTKLGGKKRTLEPNQNTGGLIAWTVFVCLLRESSQRPVFIQYSQHKALRIDRHVAKNRKTCGNSNKLCYYNGSEMELYFTYKDWHYVPYWSPSEYNSTRRPSLSFTLQQSKQNFLFWVALGLRINKSARLVNAGLGLG